MYWTVREPFVNRSVYLYICIYILIFWKNKKRNRLYTTLRLLSPTVWRSAVLRNAREHQRCGACACAKVPTWSSPSLAVRTQRNKFANWTMMNNISRVADLFTNLALTLRFQVLSSLPTVYCLWVEVEFVRCQVSVSLSLSHLVINMASGVRQKTVTESHCEDVSDVACQKPLNLIQNGPMLISNWIIQIWTGIRKKKYIKPSLCPVSR